MEISKGREPTGTLRRSDVRLGLGTIRLGALVDRPAAYTLDQYSIASDSCIAEVIHSRIFPVPVPTRSTTRRNR
jgi:hypothetical protein